MKPLKIGLTGGIGSGKTTVANLFKAFNIPVYIADVEAKKLMVTSKVLIRQLKQLLGEDTYINGELNKPYVASKIFKDEVLLNKMNAIVHPKVARHFKRWYNKQTSPYVISESALIFENNTQSNYDAVISVIADESVRLKRVIKRDQSNIDKVKAIMSHQTSNEIKINLSDYIIENEDLDLTRKAVKHLHFKLLELVKKQVI